MNCVHYSYTGFSSDVKLPCVRLTGEGLKQTLNKPLKRQKALRKFARPFARLVS